MLQFIFGHISTAHAQSITDHILSPFLHQDARNLPYFYFWSTWPSYLRSC